jgi:hypothetical protein
VSGETKARPDALDERSDNWGERELWLSSAVEGVVHVADEERWSVWNTTLHTSGRRISAHAHV